MTKKILESKTKTGAVMVSTGLIITTVGKVLTGELDPFVAAPILLAEFGALLVLFGLRNALPN